MSIVHLSYASDGGASRAGRRAHLACSAAGLESDFAFVDGEPVLQSDIRLAVSAERHGQADSKLREILTKRVQWEFVPEHRSALTNTLLTIPYPGVGLADHRVIATAEIIHLHWPTWAVTPRTIEQWLEAGQTVFWTLHDFWPMTGGCHYPAGCEQYKTVCMKCPQLKNDTWIVSNSFAEKARGYSRGGSLWIVTPSKFLAERARESAILGTRPIHAVPNPIELNRFAPPEHRAELRESFGVARDDFVLFFGSVDFSETRKGARLLVEAVRELAMSGELAARLPKNAQLQLALTGKSSLSESIPGVRRLDCGQINDDGAMADVLGVADLVCVPSLEDNYPNVIVEAMACGTPCLGFSAGGIAEMIEDGKTGILVPKVGSVAGLKEGILRFATSHFHSEEMRTACRAAAERTNAPEAIGTRLKTLYEAALGRPLASAKPELRRRVIRAFVNSPTSYDVGTGQDFLRFPANVSVLKLAEGREQLASFRIQPLRRTHPGTRLISVRTQHEHHSGRSGPYQFLRHLPHDRYDASHYAIPLGGELAGPAQGLYRQAGMLLDTPAFGEQANYWRAEPEILIQCADEEVDIVHFIDGEHGGWLLPSLPAGLYKNGRRPRYIATFHQPPGLLKPLINLRALARLDGVVVLCAAQRKFLADYVAEERLFLVPHGVDTEFFRPPGGDFAKRTDGKFRLILVGHWLRDLDTAFDALDLIERRGLDFELTIISPNFPARRQHPRVHLLSGLSDEALREAYWTSDLLMIPLIDATANNSILEAMACGRPVISTDVGGVGEAIGRRSGLLVPPADPAALAEGVLQLASNPQRRARMGEAARKRAERFSWQEIARRHDAVYRKILEGRETP